MRTTHHLSASRQEYYQRPARGAISERYAEVGFRYVMYQAPDSCDAWGYDEETGEFFRSSVCVMDDFGNAVSVDGFAHHFDGYCPYLAPDYDPSTPIGQRYNYVRYEPLMH